MSPPDRATRPESPESSSAQSAARPRDRHRPPRRLRDRSLVNHSASQRVPWRELDHHRCRYRIQRVRRARAERAAAAGWRDRLIRHGLQVLQEPYPRDLSAITRVLIRFADAGDEQRKSVEEGLRDAHTISRSASITVQALQDLVPKVVEETGAHARINGLALVRPRANAALPVSPDDGWEDFDTEIDTAPASDAVHAAVRAAADTVRWIRDNPILGFDATSIITALVDADGAAIFTNALQYVVPHDWFLVTELRDHVLPVLHRKAVGDRLRPPARLTSTDGRDSNP